MYKFWLSLLTISYLVASCVPAPLTPEQTPQKPTVTESTTTSTGLTPLEIGGHTLNVEVAITESQQESGLMNRTVMPENQGMLFVFSPSKQAAMWMKNTPLPLSVAFIDENHKIVAIKKMAPNTTTLHVAPVPVRYALETNQGWFETRSIAVGATVTIKDEKAILEKAQP